MFIHCLVHLFVVIIIRFIVVKSFVCCWYIIVLIIGKLLSLLLIKQIAVYGVFFFNGEMWTYLESNGTLLSIAIAKNIMNRQQMLVLVATFRRTYATN